MGHTKRFTLCAHCPLLRKDSYGKDSQERSFSFFSPLTCVSFAVSKHVLLPLSQSDEVSSPPPFPTLPSSRTRSSAEESRLSFLPVSCCLVPSSGAVERPHWFCCPTAGLPWEERAHAPPEPSRCPDLCFLSIKLCFGGWL